MNNRMKHVLRNIRLLSEIDRMGNALDPDVVGSLTPAEATVRLFTGFRLYPQDPVKGMAYYEYGLRNLISKRKGSIRKLERDAASGRIEAKLYHKELKKLLIDIEEFEKRPLDIPRS